MSRTGTRTATRAGNAADLASHPAPEPLQYRLITAPRGRRIWCLIHPGAVADLKKFKTVQSWRGGHLGATNFDAELITPVKNTLTGHRAPLGLFEHPEWGHRVHNCFVKPQDGFHSIASRTQVRVFP